MKKNKINDNTNLNDFRLDANSEKSESKIEKFLPYRTMMQNSINEHIIFNGLIKEMKPIDFDLEANSKVADLRIELELAKDSKMREAIQRELQKLKPKSAEKHVILIRKVLELSEKMEYGLGVYEGDFYIFNSRHWEKKDNESLMTFLAEIAEKAGLKALDVQQFKTKEKLFRQFQADAPIPGFNSQASEVRIPLLKETLIFKDGKMELTGFIKEHFLKYTLNFGYDPTAEAPLFQKALDRILPKKELQNVLFEFLGTIFTKIRHEKMLVLYGKGSNGKSLVADIVYGLLGKENVTAYDLESLCDLKSQTRANIENALINFSSEIGSGRISVDIFKKLVSGDPMEVKVIYKRPYIMEKYARLAFNCNTLPKEVENSDAFIRRFIIIPFTETISDAEKDLNLAQKIIASELPGVLNMIIKGMLRFIEQGGFTKSELVDQEIEKYRKDSNSILSFIEDERYIPSAKLKMDPNILYAQYREYCSKTGFRSFGFKNFKAQLRNENFRIERSTNGYYQVFCEKDLGLDSAVVISTLKE